MSNFPAAGYLSDAGRTKGEMKVAMEDQLQATKQLPGGLTETTLTIAAGVVTPVGGVHTLDTEGGGVTDDLATIATTNLPDGSMLWLRCASASRVVVVKHNAGGAGQIALKGAADYTLSSTAQWLVLKRTGANWEEVSRISGDVVSGALGSSRVVGAVGARASTTTYTVSSAALIEFVKPSTRTVEKIVTSQGTLTCDAGLAGPAANGRDQAGAFTASSWLYLYYIYNPTTDTKALIFSATAPPTGATLPSGYTLWAFICALRWNASSNFIATTLSGAWVNYVNADTDAMALSGGTAATFASVTISQFVPPQPTCPQYQVRVAATTGGVTVAANTVCSIGVQLSTDGTNSYTQASMQLVTGGAAGDVILNPAPIRLPTPSLYYKIVKTGATSVLNYIVTQAYENSNGG